MENVATYPTPSTGPGWLGVFQGSGSFLRALLAAGAAPWTLLLKSEGLETAGKQLASNSDLLLELFRSGAFNGVYVCPEGATFSAAVRPPVRSALFPDGVPHLKPEQAERVRHANAKCNWALEVVAAAARSGVRVVVEHPRVSCFWKLPSWSGLASPAETEDCVVDQRCFGSPFRKPTRIRTFNLGGFEPRRCQCEGKHLPLRGRNPATGSEAGKKSKKFLNYLVQHVYPTKAEDRRGHLDVAPYVWEKLHCRALDELAPAHLVSWLRSP